MSTLEFNTHFDFLTEPLHNFAYSLTKNQEDAKDLYQETAFRVINNREKFTPETNFKAWTFTIMKNIFINNYRKKMKSNVILDSSDNSFFIDSGHQTISNDGNRNILLDELQNMINSLDENLRVPFEMHFTGFKYNEIAEHFNLPLGTIKSRIFFARKALKDMIKYQYGDELLVRTA